MTLRRKLALAPLVGVGEALIVYGVSGFLGTKSMWPGVIFAFIMGIANVMLLVRVEK